VCEVVDWIYLALDGVHLRDFVRMVNEPGSIKGGGFYSLLENIKFRIKQK
jgi:hypothetical protein